MAVTLTFTNNGSVATVTGYTTLNDGAVVIPATDGLGHNVTSIGEDAFKNKTLITSLNMSGDTYLTTIGTYAFNGCSGLTGSLTIPASVTSIGDSAFYDCGIEALNVDLDNTIYSSEDGVLFNYDKTMLMICPSGKTQLDYTMPSSVTTLSSNAFHKCENLTGTMNIGSSVIDLGGVNPFAFCGVSAFNVDAGNPNYSNLDGILTDTLLTLIVAYPMNKSKLTIPNSITSIGNYAFHGCYKFTETMIIPDSIGSIGDYAFKDCTGLASIWFKGNAPSIGISISDGTPINAGFALTGVTGYELSPFPVTIITLTENNSRDVEEGVSYGIDNRLKGTFGYGLEGSTILGMI